MISKRAVEMNDQKGNSLNERSSKAIKNTHHGYRKWKIEKIMWMNVKNLWHAFTIQLQKTTTTTTHSFNRKYQSCFYGYNNHHGNSLMRVE